MKTGWRFETEPWRQGLDDLVSLWIVGLLTVWSFMGCRPLSAFATLVSIISEAPGGSISINSIPWMVGRMVGITSYIGSDTSIEEMRWGAGIRDFLTASIPLVFLLWMQYFSWGGISVIAGLSSGKRFFRNGSNSTHLATHGQGEGLNTALSCANVRCFRPVQYDPQLLD